MPSREPELYKDKIEVSLDGRQIFYLFFGGAAIVGLVFVLGVMVGRRVEARGHVDRAETPTASDPLAALDRLERTHSSHSSHSTPSTNSSNNPDSSENLSFHGTLTGNRAPTDVEKAIGEIEKKRSKIESKPETKSETKHESKAEARSGAKPETRTDKADARTDKADARTDKADARTDKADARADKSEPEAKVRFTLQLSSFQDKSEAESFLSAMKSAGFQPYLTEAEVSGKGTFYRVRLGSYRSLEAANDAKAEYEKSAKKSAQVMRL